MAYSGESGAKVIVYPRPALEFVSVGEAAAAECRFAVINPHPSEVTYKFKTNADSLGLKVFVQPPFGLIPPGANEEVAVTLTNPPPGGCDLSHLKFILESWFPHEVGRSGHDDEDLTYKLRFPCYLKGYSTPPLPQYLPLLPPSQQQPRYSFNQQLSSHPEPPRVAVQPGAVAGVSGGVDLLSATPLCFDGVRTYLIDTLPFTGGSSEAGGGGAESLGFGRLRRSDLAAYVLSMLMWISFGMTIGKGFMCSPPGTGGGEAD